MAPAPEREAAQEADDRAIGVRPNLEANTVSIRNGQDHTVILVVAT